MEPTTGDMPKLERRSSAPVKRRVSRACDHCHRMRTRCNGQSPCSRCIELEYVCQYQREKKRRGKVCHNWALACISSAYSGVAVEFGLIRWRYTAVGVAILVLMFFRCRGISKSNERRLLPLGTVRKRQTGWQATGILRGLVVSQRWTRRCGLSQKRRLSCSISPKACTTYHPASGNHCIQVDTTLLLSFVVLTFATRCSLQPTCQPHDDRSFAARF